MIILDEDPPPKLSNYSDVAGPTLRYPDRVAGRTSSLSLILPDYETSQALANNDFVKPGVKKRVDRRFWRATFYALLIYIALSAIITIPIVVTKFLRRSHHWSSPPAPSAPWHAGVEVSGPNSTLTLDDLQDATPICNSWSSSGDPSIVSAQFSIFPRGDFSIRSNVSDDGPHFVHGGFSISMNPDKSATDAIMIVTMQASSVQINQNTNVCFAKTDSACDLAIYVPGNLQSGDSLVINVSLLFPTSSDSYTVNKLATWLPMFTQKFDSMDKTVTFNKATIEGAHSPFMAGYVQANHLLVKTSLENITGTFNIKRSLTLDTVDAPINASITLNNDHKDKEPTLLTLDTGNGRIDTQILLHAPLPIHHRHRPRFLTAMKTFNSPLRADITHDEVTPPSEFHLRAQNNLAETYVTLDPKYQGTFDLQTKLAPAILQEEDEKDLIADPRGDGVRSYQYDHTSETRIFGWVGWGKRPTQRKGAQGHVEIVSSHSRVMLQLEGAGSRSSS